MELKILFLDDDAIRHERFQKHFKDSVRVWNAASCITQLKKGDWGVVYLDHDLNGIHFDDPGGDNSGSYVVRWILQNSPKVGKFIVHSYNTVQAPIMVENLQKAGYAASWEPFSF